LGLRHQALVDFHSRLHCELTGFLRQHCPVCDERHLVLLGWMLVGLLLSQTVFFVQGKRSVSLSRSRSRSRWSAGSDAAAVASSRSLKSLRTIS
jgi:hypothetical protein